MNDVQLQQALDAFNTLVKEGWRDKNITERRVRCSKVRRAYDRVLVELKETHRITHERKPKPRPTTLHAALLAKGWVNVSVPIHRRGTLADNVQQRLLALGSPSAFRGWLKRYGPDNRYLYELAAAPKWAVVVAAYAPARLKELFDAKQRTRDALTFQLESQYGPVRL